MSMYSAKGRGKLLPKATNKEYGVVKGGGDVEITNKGEIKIREGAVKPKWEVLSSDDYDALEPKDPFTVYLVTDVEGVDAYNMFKQVSGMLNDVNYSLMKLERFDEPKEEVME